MEIITGDFSSICSRLDVKVAYKNYSHLESERINPLVIASVRRYLLKLAQERRDFPSIDIKEVPDGSYFAIGDIEESTNVVIYTSTSPITVLDKPSHRCYDNLGAVFGGKYRDNSETH